LSKYLRYGATLTLLSGSYTLALGKDETELWKAANRADIARVRELLGADGGRRPTGRDASLVLLQLTPHYEEPASIGMRLSIAELLVQHGADINFTDPNVLGGMSPIHSAAENLFSELVRFLAERGADPNLTASHTTPLGYAMQPPGSNGWFHALNAKPKPTALWRREHNEALVRCNQVRRTVLALLEGGADPIKPCNLRGSLPFHIACYWGETGLVKAMLAYGAEPNVRRVQSGTSAAKGIAMLDNTALHAAALRDSPKNAEIVRLLLAAGADPSAKDRLGRTPLELARQKGNALVAKAFGG
jgi:ankyrin repeat protein